MKILRTFIALLVYYALLINLSLIHLSALELYVFLALMGPAFTGFYHASKWRKTHPRWPYILFGLSVVSLMSSWAIVATLF